VLGAFTGAAEAGGAGGLPVHSGEQWAAHRSGQELCPGAEQVQKGLFATLFESGDCGRFSAAHWCDGEILRTAVPGYRLPAGIRRRIPCSLHERRTPHAALGEEGNN